MLKYNRIRGYSQAIVVQHLNIAQNTLSKYELGERNIPVEILIGLALFYSTSTDYLLGISDTLTPPLRKNTK